MRSIEEMKSVTRCIENISEKSDLKIEDTIVVEHRSGNPKRDYLFVNKMQGKHIPCSPNKTIDMCVKLGRLVSESLPKNANALVIGFAETATAIANITAMNIEQCKYYMQTTREFDGIDKRNNSNIYNIQKVFDFQEEHSHATLQELLTWRSDPIDFGTFDRIIFIDDEISTGKTVLNFIDCIKNHKTFKAGTKFTVASICNWQDDESTKSYNQLGIETVALFRGTLKDRNYKVIDDTDNVRFIPETDINTLKDELRENDVTRVTSLFSYSPTYSPKCNAAAYTEEVLGHTPLTADSIKCLEDDMEVIIDTQINLKDARTIRVIGFEESMTVPLLIGSILEKKYDKEVIFHATTRSKIDVIDEYVTDEANGIKNRIRIDRTTVANEVGPVYLYNTERFTDMTILVSDKGLERAFGEDGLNKFISYLEQRTSKVIIWGII